MMSTSCFLSRARGSTIACTGIHGMLTCCVGWGCRNDFALTVRKETPTIPLFCRQLLLQVQVLRLAPRQSLLVALLSLYFSPCSINPRPRSVRTSFFSSTCINRRLHVL